MLRAARHSLLAGWVVAVAAACGDGTGPVTNDINGDWLFTEQFAAPSAELVCHDTARVHVAQINASFSVVGYQYGFCVIGTSGPIPNSGDVDVRDGHIGDGASVSFRYGDCQYAGAIAAGDGAMSGTVRCTADLPGGSVTATGTWWMRRADFTPPAVTVTASPGIVSHGDTFEVTVLAGDSVGLAYVGDSVSFDWVLNTECPTPLPPEQDSVSLSGTTAQRAFRHVVPGCTEYVSVTAFARDTAGNRTDAPANYVSIVFPVSQVSGSMDDSLYTLGTTVQISVTASNTRGLGYVGYRWFNPNFAGRDSVAVTGTGVTQPFRFVIPADGPVTQLTVHLFARHRLGFLTDLELPHARTTDAIQYPVLRLSLPGGAPNDIAYAAGSDRLYLTDPAAAVVREVGLAPFTLGPTFSIGAAGASLDLSASEDSLLVALKGELALSVVRVSGGAAVTVPITPPNQINLYDVRRIRVAGNGRAMLGVGSGSGGYAVQLDLSDGAQTVRIPWYGYGTFERSGDRSRILFIDNTSPLGSQLYLAATDTFLPHQSGVVSLFGSQALISGDDAATTWLVQCELLTADVVPIRILTDPSVSYGASALAPNAARAYCARGDGFVEFDAETGDRVRAVWLPERPEYLRALPRNRVVAATGNRLYLVTVP